jgi:ferredoxin
MQKVLHINADKCTGCLQCEMACSFENYGTFATAKSRIKVFDFHHTGKKVPYTCTQCDEACLAPSITCRKLARCRSAICAVASPLALTPAPPARLLSSMPTGPAWAGWLNGPTSLAINPPLHKENQSCHGQEKSSALI